MLPDQVSNPGPLTYESGALPIALRGPVNILKLNYLLNIQNTIYKQKYLLNKKNIGNDRRLSVANLAITG